MRVAVLKEDAAVEPRVAATPESVKKLVGARRRGRGRERRRRRRRHRATTRYREAGAEIAAKPRASARRRRSRPQGAPARRPLRLQARRGGVALMDPYGNEAALQRMAEAGLMAFSLELIPRITRAQVMDVLSSQANLAGYQAVIEAAAHFSPRHADDDDGGRHGARRARLRHGRRRRRPAGDRHRAPARRDRHRDRRPPRRQGAGRLARREVRRGGGRGVQGGRDRRRLRQGDVEGLPGEAGGAGEGPHRQAGHRHHHGADPRPAGAEARQRRDGRLDGRRLGDRRSRGGARRQCRGRRAGRDRQGRRRHHHRLSQHGGPHPGLVLGAARAQHLRLRRADDRQGDEGARDQPRRRDRRRDASDRGRRDRASGLRAEGAGEPAGGEA